MDKKLSLVAQFDDNCRLINSVSNQTNGLHSAFIRLIENAEENRLKWLSERNELKEIKKELEKINYEKKCLQTTLKNLRFSLTKEMQLKEKLQKDFETLRHNTKMAIGFLSEDKDNNRTREKVLSCFNLNQLDPVLEVTSSDESVSDLDYDKTEEDIFESSAKTAVTAAIGGTPLKNKRKSIEAYESVTKISENDLSKRSKSDEENMEINDEINDHKLVSRSLFKSEAELKISGSGFVNTSRMVNIQSTPILSRKDSQLSRITPSTKITQTIESRMHTFVTKKNYTLGKTCGPCGGVIGFCSSFLNCRDCKALAHVECKDKVPLPCVPVVTPNSHAKSGRLLLISDYVTANARPRIPALIVHCCKEIEKRGLNEEGLYRVPGSVKDVKNLKEQILNSKTGMPSLRNIDIHVICSVVKDFLRSFDEQLITRILWRDFVSASTMGDHKERNIFLLQAIDELPTANRDTLAFLMLHLQKISKSNACKMPVSNLSRIFGPAIVGNTVKEPNAWLYQNEQPKQIQVVEALLNIPSDDWNLLINPNVDESTLNNIKENRRSSMINHMSVGTLTPMRYKLNSGVFRPLF